MGSRWPRLDPLLLPPALACHQIPNYDVVIFHSYLGWAFHALRRWLDPVRRVATITSFHGLEPLYHSAIAEEYRRMGRQMSMRFKLLHHVILPQMLKASCRASDAVFCLNSGEASYLVQRSWADSDRIYRVANGVEPECFVQRVQRERPRRLLFVGQWLPGKGIRYLTEAFSMVAERRDIELSCVGTGASPEIVLGAFPEDVRSRVSVQPVVGRTQIYQELSQADVFVFPSLSEGFSCALLEAMAAGLPVIATQVGAANDLLQPDRNAVVVPCADVRALSEGIVRLLEHSLVREQLGAAAQYTAASYTSDAANASFAECVNQVERRHALEFSQRLAINGNSLS